MFILIWQEEVLGEERWVYGEEAGERLLTLRHVGSQGGLEELDSICRAQGLPLLMPLELNGLKCLCVRAHLRARALAPLPCRSFGCCLMLSYARAGAKFNSFGRALPLIRLPPLRPSQSTPHSIPLFPTPSHPPTNLVGWPGETAAVASETDAAHVSG